MDIQVLLVGPGAEILDFVDSWLQLSIIEDGK